jgi:hypothetical protein
VTEFFISLAKFHILTVSFILGSIAIVLAIIGKYNSKLDLSRKQRAFLGGIGLLFVILGVGGHFASLEGQESREIPTVELGVRVDLSEWQAYTIQGANREKTPLVVGSSVLAGGSPGAVEVANVELRTARDPQSGFNRLEQSLLLSWSHPVRDIPYDGMIAQLLIEPAPGNEEYKLFCRFVAEYEIGDIDRDIYVYTGSEHFVSMDQWNTLVWDFTGTLWSQGTPWEDEWADLSERVLSKGHSYVFLKRRLGEQALYDAVGARFHNMDSTWMERFKSLGIECFVSAFEHYTEAQNPVFRGDFHLSNIWTQPTSYPGLP